jgi:hypothetical protein
LSSSVNNGAASTVVASLFFTVAIKELTSPFILIKTSSISILAAITVALRKNMISTPDRQLGSAALVSYDQVYEGADKNITSAKSREQQKETDGL